MCKRKKFVPAEMARIVEKLKQEGRMPSEAEFLRAMGKVRQKLQSEFLNAKAQSNDEVGRTMWSVIFRYDASGRWYRGAERFSTTEDAEEYGYNCYQAHSSIKEYRIVPAPEGANNSITEDR